jgi:hypothetical protein
MESVNLAVLLSHNSSCVGSGGWPTNRSTAPRRSRLFILISTPERTDNASVFPRSSRFSGITTLGRHFTGRRSWTTSAIPGAPDAILRAPREDMRAAWRIGLAGLDVPEPYQGLNGHSTFGGFDGSETGNNRHVSWRGILQWQTASNRPKDGWLVRYNPVPVELPAAFPPEARLHTRVILAGSVAQAVRGRAMIGQQARASEGFEPVGLCAVVAGLSAQRPIRHGRLHQSGERNKKTFGGGTPPRVITARDRAYGNIGCRRRRIMERWQEIGLQRQASEQSRTTSAPPIASRPRATAANTDATDVPIPAKPSP